jgi:molybdopterin-guanine dinucleotide biosynthesis protein A
VGVVLAGGQSTRMGTPKAALEIAGEPLLRRVVGRLMQAVPDVLVVGPSSLQTFVPGVPVLPDVHAGLGPLGGLETALDAVAPSHAFVVACDMPFVSPALVSYLAKLAEQSADVDVVVLRTAEGREYLHAVYAATCLPVIRQQLDAGAGAVGALFARLRVRDVDAAESLPFDPHGLSAFNANAPEEWNRALAIAAASDSP